MASAGKSQRGGSGPSMVREWFIRTPGGRRRVASAPGSGSTFGFTLPVVT